MKMTLSTMKSPGRQSAGVKPLAKRATDSEMCTKAHAQKGELKLEPLVDGDDPGGTDRSQRVPGGVGIRCNGTRRARPHQRSA
jgi:hypothetical protein